METLARGYLPHLETQGKRGGERDGGSSRNGAREGELPVYYMYMYMYVHV